MNKGASFSKDKLHRFSLFRIWDYELPKVLFIMFNPSEANQKEDDPTIRRVIDFSTRWGFGGVYVGNIFSYISKDPKNIKIVNPHFNHKNIKSIVKMEKDSSKTILAWGNNAITPKWIKRVVKDPNYIELSVNGIPKHPLYLKKKLKYKRFEFKNVDLSDVAI